MKEGCIDFLSVTVHANYAVTIRVVVNNKVSNGPSNRKSRCVDGSDNVEFAGMLIHSMYSVREAAWGRLWQLVYIKVENVAWGSSGC